MIKIVPSKNARFEQRYPRATVEQVKAILRTFADPQPSYRSLSQYFADYCNVKISGPTVKRLMEKLNREKQ